MSKIFTLILVLITINVSAQPIVIDDSFNPQDIGDGNATWVTGDMMRHCLIQTDGKIIVPGNMSRYRDRDAVCNGIARLNTDGSVDAAFQTGSGSAGPSGNFITQVVQQADGKLIIVGAFASFNCTSSI